LLQHIVLFHGPNIFFLNQTLTRWKNTFCEKHGGDLNVEMLEGSQTKSADIIEKSACLPFLSEKRLIIIKNFLNETNKEDQKKLTDNLDKIPDFTVVIFAEFMPPDKRTALFKKLSKDCRVEFFEELNDLSLTKWIIDEVKKNNGQISANNANYLSMYVGNDCTTLHQEIQKLTLYKGKNEISKEDIEKLTSPVISMSIFKLTDAIGFKKTKDALNILEKIILSGEDLQMVFHMLIRQFRLIILIKELQNQGLPNAQIASQLKQHPFIISTISKQTVLYKPEELEKIYDKLLEIEITFKTGKISVTVDDKREFILALEKLVVSL